MENLTKEYFTALEKYLKTGDETTLEMAYEISRKAIAEGVGLLDIANSYHQVLEIILNGNAAENRKKTILATEFLMESLSPFEMTHQGFQEANAVLKKLNETLEIKVQERTKELQEILEKLQRVLSETTDALASAIEMRDPYTAGHEKRVAKLAGAIAVQLMLSENQIEGIRVSGHLHDFGKIVVPSEILSKPGKLTEFELRLIQNHPKAGFDSLKDIEFPWPVAEIILQHHERLDGSGYPAGLKEDEILLEAKIIAVADVIEAMSSHRPYRPALGVKAALQEIEQNKGKLYDPNAVDAYVKLFRKKKYRL